LNFQLAPSVVIGTFDKRPVPTFQDPDNGWQNIV
jgi:hypothetical protein